MRSLPSAADDVVASYETTTRSGLYPAIASAFGVKPESFVRGALGGIVRLVVDRDDLLAGADREEVLGRGRRERDDPHRLAAIVTLPSAASVTGKRARRRPRRGRERTAATSEPGTILSFVTTKNLRVWRREVARRLARTNRPSSEGWRSSAWSRRPGSSPEGASQLRDSAGIAPASLWYTGMDLLLFEPFLGLPALASTQRGPQR